MSGLVDCDVHVAPPSVDRLLPYLDGYWREYVREAGFVIPDGPAYTYPPGAPTTRRADACEAPGMTLESVQAAVLDCPGGAEKAILTCYYGIETPRNPNFTVAFARAVNDWLVAEWLDRDPRLRASVVVPVQHPEVAAAEIDRVGGHPGFVQVLFPARGERPYGHHCHDPIYAAAVRHDLAIGIHYGGLSVNPPSPTGWYTYHLEDYVGITHVFQSQLTSIVVEGVFARFPDVRFALVESAVTWLPSLLWRLDKEWRGIRREAPWVKKEPSEYVRTRMRATIAPFDAPDTGEHLLQVVDQIGCDDFLLYASDWPHDHGGAGRPQLLDLVPDSLARRIRSGNARAFYRL